MLEAERQVLIAYIELFEPVETENNHGYPFYPKTLEEAAAYFGKLREDWTDAYSRLVEQGCLTYFEGEYHLTETGKGLARRERLDCPPIYYWYRTLYPLMAHSRVYDRFCQLLYGASLHQAGFSDLAQIEFLMDQGKLGPETRILDLGCGLGDVVEYISDRCGAQAWGLDYSPEAVQLALARTDNRRDRLHFILGNLDHLEDVPKIFTTLLSIDTLYMPNQLAETLCKMRELLVSGGQMLVFYSCFAFQPEERNQLAPDQNPLGQALEHLGLSYETWDFSEAMFYMMQRKHRLAVEMKAEFEAEGSLELVNFPLSESEAGEGPYDPSCSVYSRYLYRIVC
jgi:SAM-dependent methyltransferase